MSDTDHEHGHDAEDRPDYDPKNPRLPPRAPPLRSTAPQSSFTSGQVATGFLVFVVGLVLTAGLTFVLV